MNVNSIKNINFAGSLKINHNIKNENVGELELVLNNKETPLYSKEEAQAIKSFFISSLADYDGTNGAIVRKVKDKTFVFSGQDIKKVEKFEQEKEQGVQNLAKNAFKFDTNMNNAQYKTAVKILENNIKNLAKNANTVTLVSNDGEKINNCSFI